MQEAGIKWGRQDFTWKRVETKKDVYDGGPYDRLVEAFPGHTPLWVDAASRTSRGGAWRDTSGLVRQTPLLDGVPGPPGERPGLKVCLDVDTLLDTTCPARGIYFRR